MAPCMNTLRGLRAPKMDSYWGLKAPMIVLTWGYGPMGMESFFRAEGPSE